MTGKWTDEEEEEEEEEEQHHFRSLSYVIVSSRPSFPLILSQANTPFTIVLQTWQEMNRLRAHPPREDLSATI